MRRPIALRRGQAGFVLAELLVALVIAAIIGAALTQLVVSQSRFAALQGGIVQARGGARAALNVMATDFRMVTDHGLVAATPESVTVRAPYAFGVACGPQAGKMVMGLLPTDSATFFSASPSGYAWLDATGAYRFVEPATAPYASTGKCMSASPKIVVQTGIGWPTTEVGVSPADTATKPGNMMYLYQLVRYAFAPSGQLPGRIGLWRTVLSTGARDELVAPFDSISGFQFLDSTYTAKATPPADLTKVYGLRLVLVAASETAPEGRSKPVEFNMTTDVLFRNHP